MIDAAPTTTTLVSSKSKSSVDNTGELLNNEDVVLVMKRKLAAKKFRITNWSLDPIEGTHGFMGQYYILRVNCSVEDKLPEKFKFFAKAKPPRNSPQYDLATRGNLYNKEIRVYEDLIPRMGRGNGPKWSADCFLGKRDVIIVLEDATEEGYSMPDKYVPFGYDECALMIRSLATLHARSLILDENLRRRHGKTIFDAYGEILVECLFPSQDKTEQNIIDSGIQGTGAMIDLIEDLDDLAKRRVKNRLAKWAWNIPNLVRPSDKYRNLICHRDPWANNFMLKRDSTGRPNGWYLVDFQFWCYLPPAADFVISLYLNTRRKTRDELFETMAKMHHETMRKELDSEGLDIEDCLSWNEFRESCEAYRPLGIIYTTVNLQIMLMDGETANKYFAKSPELLQRVIWGCDRAELVCPMFATKREYRERITENVMEINERLPDDLPKV